MLRFYDRLFAKYPELKSMFSTDLTRQSEKLAYTIGFIVGNIERLNEIKTSVEHLGRFHNKLAIKEEHYEKVKEVLIETIRQELGNKFTHEIGEAWDEAIDRVSDVMLSAPGRK